GLFWAALAYPPRIHKPRLFRLAIILETLSLMAPSVFMMLFTQKANSLKPDEGLLFFSIVIPPLLKGICLALALISISPIQRPSKSAAAIENPSVGPTPSTANPSDNPTENSLT
ncbi:MAG: hypothetical protein VX438_05875, partial [Planctomycetota bacterium]|nr:hypothetical protein [Planctomycetota bacterium]